MPLPLPHQAYHPLCGRMAGLHMEVAAEPGPHGKGSNLRIVTYCPKHCKPQPKLSGERLRSPACTMRCVCQGATGASKGQAFAPIPSPPLSSDWP